MFSTVVRTRVRACGALALAAAAWTAAVAPSAAAGPATIGPGPWQGPTQLIRETGAQFSTVATTLAADGGGLVVFASRRPELAIRAVDVTPAGAIGAPVVLSQPRDHAAAPLAGMADDGEAVVAWRTGRGAQGVSACLRAAAGGPCVVQRISSPGRRAVLQSLAVGSDGAAVAGWLQRTRDGWRAAVAERPAGQPFGRPRLVGPPRATAAIVALGPGSRALAIGRAKGRRGAEVRVATWLRGEPPPSATLAISPASHVAAAPQIAIDGDDSAVVAWQRVHRSNAFAIAHARVRDCHDGGCERDRDRLARFGAQRRLGPRLVRRGPQASTGGLVVSASSDRLVLGWIHLPGDDDAPTEIRVAQWSRGVLTTAVRVSDARYSGFDPQLRVAGGRTVAIYREYGRPGVRDGLVAGAIADGGALSFGALAGLSDPALIQQSPNQPRLALASSGAALSAFTNYGAGGSGAGEVAISRLPPP